MRCCGLGTLDRHLSTTSERERHRATIQTNPYPSQQRHQRPAAPASSFAVLLLRSPVSLSRHTPLSLSVTYTSLQHPRPTPFHSRLLFSPAPAPFHFTSPVSLLPRPACACLFGCLSCPSSSRSRPGKSRPHATTTSSRAKHRSLTHSQPPIVLRVLFV
jgi:hypothetical protein